MRDVVPWIKLYIKHRTSNIVRQTSYVKHTLSLYHHFFNNLFAKRFVYPFDNFFFLV